jgi:hypothetical protein
MSADIVKLYTNTAAENPDNVLELAVGEFESVIVVGWNKSGLLDLRASTNVDHKEINWIFGVAQSKLLRGDYS